MRPAYQSEEFSSALYHAPKELPKKMSLNSDHSLTEAQAFLNDEKYGDQEEVKKIISSEKLQMLDSHFQKNNTPCFDFFNIGYEECNLNEININVIIFLISSLK